MSNASTGCFINFFKKSQNRESNEDNRHIRRSRSSSFLDPLSYLRPRKDDNRQMNLEHEFKDREKNDNPNNDILRARERQEKEKAFGNDRSCRRPKEKTLAKDRRKNQTDSKLINDGKLTGKTKANTTTTGVAESEDDFKQNIEILEKQIDNLDLRSKVMATMWLSRLRAPTQDGEEIRARNIITAHLIKCRNENIFQKVPFNLPPTSDTLANIKQKMVLTRDTLCQDSTLANRMETKAYLNKLFHDSYDGGKFLGKLPVPRNGAFFILHMRSNL